MEMGYKAVINGSTCLCFLSVVPAALKIIEDEVRSPKAVSRSSLVGGQERAAEPGAVTVTVADTGRWQMLSSRPGYLVLGANFLRGLGTGTCRGAVGSPGLGEWDPGTKSEPPLRFTSGAALLLLPLLGRQPLTQTVVRPFGSICGSCLQLPVLRCVPWQKYLKAFSGPS